MHLLLLIGLRIVLTLLDLGVDTNTFYDMVLLLFRCEKTIQQTVSSRARHARHHARQDLVFDLCFKSLVEIDCMLWFQRNLSEEDV
jgi:hypothetical protein